MAHTGRPGNRGEGEGVLNHFLMVKQYGSQQICLSICIYVSIRYAFFAVAGKMRRFSTNFCSQNPIRRQNKVNKYKNKELGQRKRIQTETDGHLWAMIIILILRFFGGGRGPQCV